MERIEKFKTLFVSKKSSLGDGKLIVFYGPPCSGKTTISKLLAEKYNLHRVTLDLIRAQYFEEEELFTDSNNIEVFKFFIDIVEFLVHKNQSVICEGLFISDDRKKQMTDINPNALFVYFTASLDILTKRLIKRYEIGKNSEGLLRETLTQEQLIHFYNISMPPKKDILVADTEKYQVDQTFSLVDNLFKTEFSIN